MRHRSVNPRFVEFMPETLEEGVLYVSMEYATAVHLCFCGCGSKVVTPLGPTDWRIVFDGKVSLEPSIGSWELPCRSHYWVTKDSVRWAPDWSDDMVRAGRELDIKRKAAHYAGMEFGSPILRSKPERDHLGARLLEAILKHFRN